jgi:hypothetical protein
MQLSNLGKIGSIVIAAAALGACAIAPVVWTKPDATPTLASQDLAECRHLAADEMWRLGWERSWPPRFYDPLFMPPYYRGPRAFWLEFPLSIERERALVDFCMHSKGYRLEALPY